jgi:DNA-binding transcriptional ArsR family regulator
MKNRNPRLSGRQIAGIARLFQTLGEASRLRLLQALMRGPATVGELVRRTGLQQANASRHLAGLGAAGLLVRHRQGRFVTYSIGDPLVYRLCDLVCGKLERDAREAVASLQKKS